jgi:hypothetical protein
MGYSDLQKNREWFKEYRKTHPRDYKREYDQEYRKAHPNTTRQNQDYRLRVKLEVFNAYGGARCACCGEEHIEFLSLDHIGNNGAEHRKSVPATTLYNWIRKNGFPPGFQVLCMNCNFAKGHFGKCPHQEHA